MLGLAIIVVIAQILYSEYQINCPCSKSNKETIKGLKDIGYYDHKKY